MKWIRIGIIVTACAVIAGCSALEPVKQESLNTFALESGSARQAIVPARDAPSLVVSPVSARPGFDSARMAYVRTPHELEYFTKNQWVDTPARMLTPLLVQAAESSGAFGAVATSRSGVVGQLRLESEIVRLQQEFVGAQSRVHFTLRIQLMDAVARKVLATREFDVTENASSADPYGGVQASNRAVRRVLEEVALFFASQPGKPQP